MTGLATIFFYNLYRVILRFPRQSFHLRVEGKVALKMEGSFHVFQECATLTKFIIEKERERVLLLSTLSSICAVAERTDMSLMRKGLHFTGNAQDVSTCSNKHRYINAGNIFECLWYIMITHFMVKMT